MSDAGCGQPTGSHGGAGRWRWPYRVAAAAATISVVLIPISLVAFFVWPPWPDDILILLQQDRLVALMGLDLLYLMGNLVAIPFFLVLYVTLRRVDKGWALIALTPGLIGLFSIILSRRILEMVAISDVYGRAAAYAGIVL